MKLKMFFIRCCLLVLGLSFGLASFWLFYPYNVIDIAPDPFPMKKDVFRRGEALQWDVDIVHHTDGIRVDVIRQLQNSIIINFSQAGYATKKGRQQFTNSSLEVPPYAPEGTYKLAITSIFHVNPLRSIVITRTSEPFQIVK